MRCASLLLLAACAPPPACPEGQVREDGACVAYVAGDPVDRGDAWLPAAGTTWQWQLSGAIETDLDVAMYDVDLVDAPDSALAAILGRGAALVCYFSAGTVEDWRDDAGDFDDAAIGDPLPEWEGERWLDITDSSVLAVMELRLDLAVARGCTGVEPDNVDGYANDNGVGLNASEQLRYNRWLADEAHLRGLSVGLKNDLDQIDDLLPWFDWALNEECAAYDECGRLSAFTDNNQAAFHVEYVDDWADAADLALEVCGSGSRLSTLIKTWDLGAEWMDCG